jgi:hypothetical protein
MSIVIAILCPLLVLPVDGNALLELFNNPMVDAFIRHRS